MIDRSARDQMAQALRYFIEGRVSNFDFEKEVPISKDPIIPAIESSIWCFYDDFKEQKMSGELALPKETKKLFARWLMFLYADYEYVWPSYDSPGVLPVEHGLISKLFGGPKKEKTFMASGQYDYWPFIDKESYESAKNSPRLLAG